MCHTGFLMYLNYFIGKEYGTDYWKDVEKVVDLSLKQRSIDKVITDCFEQIVYSINQPTGARNYRAVFWNIAYYDKPYFESLFGEFRFPDGSRPTGTDCHGLQEAFHEVVQQRSAPRPCSHSPWKQWRCLQRTATL